MRCPCTVVWVPQHVLPWHTAVLVLMPQGHWCGRMSLEHAGCQQPRNTEHVINRETHTNSRVLQEPAIASVNQRRWSCWTRILLNKCRA